MTNKNARKWLNWSGPCTRPPGDPIVAELLTENQKFRIALEKIMKIGGYTEMQQIAQEALNER